jgi:putative PIN family toxin of toxin-antitoxin system
MRNVVLDASVVVAAALKRDSIPERALLLARAHDRIWLSSAVIEEIRGVLDRPKFVRYLDRARIDVILDLLVGASRLVEPGERVTDCRDPKDDRYLELALTANAEIIVSSDEDLRVLHPWRGVAILSPADYVAGFA